MHNNKISPALLILVCLVGFSSPGRIHRPQQEDACPNVEWDPKHKGYKLTRITLDGVTKLCCACNRGQKATALCEDSQGNIHTTACSLCEEGSYMDEYHHNRTSCKKQITSCPDDRVLITGNSTLASRCDCKEGFHLTSTGNCEAHSTCGVHYGVMIHGNPFRDTTCEPCPYGYDSLEVSATEQCSLKQSYMKSHATTKHPIPNNGHSADIVTNSFLASTPVSLQDQGKFNLSSEKHRPQQSGYVRLWIAASLAILLFLVIVFLCYFIYRHRMYQKKSSKCKKASNRTEEVWESRNKLQIDRLSFSADEGKDNPALPKTMGNEEDCISSDSAESTSTYTESMNLPRSSSLRKHSTRNANGCDTSNYINKTKPTKPDPNDKDEVIMKRIKQQLSEITSLDDTFHMFRKFCMRKTTEQDISYYRRQNVKPHETFLCVFEELEKHGLDHFNHKRLRDFFEERHHMAVVETIDKIVEDVYEAQESKC